MSAQFVEITAKLCTALQLVLNLNSTDKSLYSRYQFNIMYLLSMAFVFTLIDSIFRIQKRYFKCNNSIRVLKEKKCETVVILFSKDSR